MADYSDPLYDHGRNDMKVYGTLLMLVPSLFLAASVLAQPSPHDRAFWKAIVASNYAVPQHESADALVEELSGLLASPDPELRDDLAYSILTRWIYRRSLLSTPTLLAVTDTLRANLKTGIGESRTNSVLKRSFSALCLAGLAERDSRLPFMGSARYHELVAEAVAYLQAERDLRGYDPILHWIHATAHTADLLAALADSPQLTAREAATILDAITARVSTAGKVYTQGEQDRLAGAVLSVIHRPDFDTRASDHLLARLKTEDREVWTATTLRSLTRYQNHNYLLQSLYVRLALETDSPRIIDFRQKVLAILKERVAG
jgi:hypothetical protein